jgi:small conductance mechanosensitive channel
MTAAEQIGHWWNRLTEYLTDLHPTELAINIGLTVLVVILMTAVTVAFRRLVERGWKSLGSDSVATAVHLSRLAKLLLFGLRIVLLAFGIYFIALVWSLDLIAWASTTAGAAIVTATIRLILLLFAIVVGNEAVRFLVSQALERLAHQTTDLRRAAQINTLGPVLRGLAQTALLIIGTLMVLGELGVQIGPLIAGAGVVGIAVGFGAQTLVKDFLTGMFLIAEDVVSVGDIVTVSGSGGVVERMTLRTIQLRAFDGTLHVFPYSEAQVVHNLTKTFSFYVFVLLISYESDIDKALAVMHEVGAELQADLAFKNKILEPIEVVGVDGFADSGITLKARIKTLPMQQWSVGREYNRRIKTAFDRAGISIPYPHVHLTIPKDENPGTDGAGLALRRNLPPSVGAMS